jgi:RNA polymerase sigma factor (sigma-70 family)
MKQTNQTVEWIPLFQAGSLKAIRELCRQHFTALDQFATLLIHHKGLVRKIVIDTFIRLMNRRAQLTNSADIRAFLYIHVRNACLDFLHYQKLHPGAGHNSDAWAEAGYEYKEQVLEDEKLLTAATTLLDDAVLHLPGTQAEIFRLIFLEGLPAGAVAKQLQMDMHEVLQQRHQCIHQLEKVLSGNQLYSIPFLIHYLTIGCKRKTPVTVPVL